VIDPRRRYIASKHAAIALGIAGFLVGSWFLYQAWEARGEKTPRLLRPFTWW
jgi:hypothetical protein